MLIKYQIGGTSEEVKAFFTKLESEDTDLLQNYVYEIIKFRSVFLADTNNSINGLVQFINGLSGYDIDKKIGDILVITSELFPDKYNTIFVRLKSETNDRVTDSIAVERPEIEDYTTTVNEFYLGLKNEYTFSEALSAVLDLRLSFTEGFDASCQGLKQYIDQSNNSDEILELTGKLLPDLFENISSYLNQGVSSQYPPPLQSQYQTTVLGTYPPPRPYSQRPQYQTTVQGTYPQPQSQYTLPPPPRTRYQLPPPPRPLSRQPQYQTPVQETYPQ